MGGIDGTELTRVIPDWLGQYMRGDEKREIRYREANMVMVMRRKVYSGYIDGGIEDTANITVSMEYSSVPVSI